MFRGSISDGGENQIHCGDVLPRPQNPVGFTEITCPTTMDAREAKLIRVKVWYPSAVSLSPIKSYKTLSRRVIGTGAPIFQTHARTDALLSYSKKKYPVLFFIADAGCQPEYYSILCEQFASHDFVVFCMAADSHQSQPLWLLKALCSNLRTPGFQKLRHLRKLSKLQFADRWDEQRRLTKLWHTAGMRTINWSRANSALKKFLMAAQSATFLPSAPGSFLYPQLDFENFFVAGHGLGGAAAAQMAIADKTIRGIVNLNGFQLVPVTKSTFDTPLLVVYGEQYAGMNEGLYFPAPEEPAVVMPGASHLCFTDVPFWNRKCAPPFATTALRHVLERSIAFLEKHRRPDESEAHRTFVWDQTHMTDLQRK